MRQNLLQNKSFTNPKMVHQSQCSLSTKRELRKPGTPQCGCMVKVAILKHNLTRQEVMLLGPIPIPSKINLALTYPTYMQEDNALRLM